MGFIEGPPAPKRIPLSPRPTVISKFKFQQEKVARKSIVNRILNFHGIT